MIGRRVPPASSGVPGESREARLRRAIGRRKWGVALGAFAGWAVLVALIGPNRPVAEPPALGPAKRDYLAAVAFDVDEAVPDLASRLERAVVPSDPRGPRPRL